MKKGIGILLLVLMTSSCRSIAHKNLVYYIHNYEAAKIISKIIQQYKSYKNTVFLTITGSNDNGYELTIIPVDDLDSETYGFMKVIKSGRVMKIDDRYYYVLFPTDRSLGVIVEKGEKEDPRDIYPTTRYRQRFDIHDDATTLYFDWEWNFIKKSSLIIFKE